VTKLIRYWFEFKKTENTFSVGVQLGCGVTAFNYSDALQILANKIFKNTTLPEIINCVENIDIRTLDQGHIIPNMWSPSERGIWYPLGYHDNR
jgi:hypothetical protein